MQEHSNIPREYQTAYDCRGRLPELSGWMGDDMLKQLTLWRGARFEPGEEYFDLERPERGPFVATGDEARPAGQAVVCRRQVAEPAWVQLLTWRRPISESQGESLQRIAEDFGPQPAQSAAGDARPRPQVDTRPRRRQRGVIARLTPEAGFGFIVGDDDREYFFHVSALQATRFEDLAPGVGVTFNVGHDPGDRPEEHPRAVGIHLADDTLPAVDHATLPQEKVAGP